MSLSNSVRDAALRIELEAKVGGRDDEHLRIEVYDPGGYERTMGGSYTELCVSIPWRCVGSAAQLSELSEFFRQCSRTVELDAPEDRPIFVRTDINAYGPWPDLYVGDIWSHWIGRDFTRHPDDWPMIGVREDLVKHILGRERLQKFIERLLDLQK